MITISETATLKNSSNIEMIPCHYYDQQECQDVISIKQIFHCNLKHEHDHVNMTVLHEECHASLNKANCHIPFTTTGTLIHQSIIRVYVQNIKNRKMIFMSHQHLCL